SSRRFSLCSSRRDSSPGRAAPCSDPRQPRFPHSGEENVAIGTNMRDMKLSMLLAAAFFAVGAVFVVLGGWFLLLVGIVALLMGLVLLVRGYRLRSAANA